MIEESKAIEIIEDAIENGTTHEFYKQAKKIADYAKVINATQAKGQEKEIKEVRPSETKEEKEQRVKLTKPITSLPLSQVYSYWEETYRTDGIKKTHKHGSADVQAEADTNFALFYDGQSLHEYLHKTLLSLNRYDPNAWLILNREPTEEGRRGRIYPTIASCSEVQNFSKDRFGILQYLLTKFMRVEMVKNKKEEFRDYFFYSIGYIVHYAETKSNAVHEINYEEEGYELRNVEGDNFYVQIFQTGTTVVPAIQAGAYRDGMYQDKICVTPVHDARPLLDSLINQKSIFDVAVMLHAFPEKWEFAQACNYEDEEGFCESGYIYKNDRKEKVPCPQCNGTGKIRVSSEQNVRQIKWPEEGSIIPDLSNMSFYVDRPIDILEFVDKIIDKLTAMVKLITFNQETVDIGNLVAKTATEVSMRDDKINNKLFPFAQHLANAWALAHRVWHEYNDSFEGLEAAEMVHPNDFKLKSVEELNRQYKEAKEAGQPYEVLKSIRFDILQKQHRNNPDTVKELESFERWKPFKDKSAEEIAVILMNRDNSDLHRVLWENWDQITMNIQIEREGGFHLLPPDQQRELLRREAEAFAKDIVYQGGVDTLFDQALELGG